MPIEFLCSACPKKLRVPDDSAGKKVRCPGCGHLQVIPTPDGAKSEPPSGEIRNPAPSPKPAPTPPPPKGPPPPLPTSEPNPFADKPLPPLAKEAPPNPYQSPSPAASAPSPYVAKPPGSGGMTPETAKVLLTIPVAILLVAQAVNFLASMLVVGFGVLMLTNPPQANNAPDQHVLWIGVAVTGGIGCVLSIGSIACLASTLFRKSYAAAWVGVLLGMVPCGLMTNCATILIAGIAFPAGVWAIVMLCMPEGKAQFR
ncbi:zinc-ribbon domain-containing protein [Blastopirellula sp. JC732]|uniref:Zinc-ribbon domain-containing protein n=1 Tax=Blastopirellula sediminis TaxID=2894196 RepID=A0A9X1MNZ4_9BACT|nr:zinc-ribbon domain-containing protein [Blastopirellula sediminis]MCC9606642.1 zinc-ribbon domain-containing protein [Blastopirellula sediminis]MCC9630061.1 zinc-ribbon domain-containing protein [Blastopirellula sediminis]